MKRRKGPALTREKAAAIKSLLMHTNLNHAEIAASLNGINQGRISEIKNGKRFQEVEPCTYEEAVQYIGGLSHG